MHAGGTYFKLSKECTHAHVVIGNGESVGLGRAVVLSVPMVGKHNHSHSLPAAGQTDSANNTTP